MRTYMAPLYRVSSIAVLLLTVALASPHGALADSFDWESRQRRQLELDRRIPVRRDMLGLFRLWLY